MGEDTPFAKREAGEISYELGPAYAVFFDQVLDFARKLVAARSGPEREQRVHYWTALDSSAASCPAPRRVWRCCEIVWKLPP